MFTSYTSNNFQFNSYAKINLFLHVINKRSDNYHNIQTWFQFVNLRDRLLFEVVSKSLSFRVFSNNLIINTMFNSIYKAANVIRPFAEKLCGINVYLDKYIPIGSGLGGGSSNAAVTLMVLNELWSCNLSQSDLISCGKLIGADVPLFIVQFSSWGEGVGDILFKKPYIEQYILIIKPNIFIFTKTLFAANGLRRNYMHLLNKDNIFGIHALKNVFRAMIFKLYPNIHSMLKIIPDYEYLRLTGTGACFYLLSSDIKRLKENQKKLHYSIDSYISRTLNSISYL